MWPSGVTETITTEADPENGINFSVEVVTFNLWERIPEDVFFAQGNPMLTGIRFGCDGGALGVQEHSLWIEYSGPCDNYDIYHELYGASEGFRNSLEPPYESECGRYDFAIFPGFDNPNNVGDDTNNFTARSEDQMILCGFPVVKDNLSGDDRYIYNVTVGSTSRQFTSLDGTINYRIKMVARDQFPWIRTWRDLDRGSCAYNSQLEMFVNFSTSLDIE